MAEMAENTSPTKHDNNFGLIRLFFAFMVIISHSFITAGRQDPLLHFFNSLSFGEIGVDGFFIVSGFLIAQSSDRSRTFWSFLRKRILRIYPAFIVAALICYFVVGSIAGGDFAAVTTKGWVKLVALVALLQMPPLPGAFATEIVPDLNGSMWTISYEFRCYLAIGLLGSLGILNRRKVVLGITACTFVAFVALQSLKLPPTAIMVLTGDVGPSLRLFSLFLTGTLFYLYRDLIVYKPNWAAACALVFIVSLFNPTAAHFAMALCGGYLIFALAFMPDPKWLHRVNNSDDISYGVYLYAWPIQNLIVRNVAEASPWLVLAASTVLSALAGLISWKLIEQPFNTLKRKSKGGAEGSGVPQRPPEASPQIT